MIDDILSIDEMHSPKHSFLAEAEIEALQTSKLSRDTPFVVQNCMYSQFSIARYFGAVVLNGQRYTYFPDGDELIRNDVLKFVTKLRKKTRKTEQPQQMEF